MPTYAEPAIDTPAPQVATDTSFILDGEPDVIPALVTADTANFSTYINQNSASTEAAARASVGGFAVLNGLTISNSGLTLTIATGVAIIDGIVTLTSSDSRTLVVPSSTANVWVWLKQDKALSYTTSTTPPAGKVLLIGMVTTDATTVTVTDYSGVCYAFGGTVWRTTADDLAPGDSPNADMRIFTKTTRGLYLWDGTQHIELHAAGRGPIWRKYTVPYTSLQTAGLTITFNLWNVPAGMVFEAAILEVTTALAGTSISALALDLGITGTLTKYITGLNGLALGNSGTFTPAMESRSAATQVTLRATSTGANLSALSVGSVDVWVKWSVAK